MIRQNSTSNASLVFSEVTMNGAKNRNRLLQVSTKGISGRTFFTDHRRLIVSKNFNTLLFRLV